MKQTTLASFFKKPSTKAPEEPQAKKGPGAEVVGRRLKVWWPADAAWYAGGVASYDGERHAIQYDDGDEEAVDLSKEKFEFLEGTHVPSEIKRETKHPAPSSGLTAEQRADRERKRRKASSDDDDDFVVDDDASLSEEEEEDEVFDESDDDEKPKPKKRRVIADDSDEEMPAAKASPSSVPESVSPGSVCVSSSPEASSDTSDASVSFSATVPTSSPVSCSEPVALPPDSAQAQRANMDKPTIRMRRVVLFMQTL